MRVNKVLKRVLGLGLGQEVVIVGWELTGLDGGDVRPSLQVEVGLRAGRRGRCGRCELSPRRATTRVMAGAAGGMSMSALRPVS